MRKYIKQFFCLHDFDKRPKFEFGDKFRRKMVGGWYPYYEWQYQYTCHKCKKQMWLNDERRCIFMFF